MSRRASSAVTGRSSDSYSGAGGSSRSATRLRSNSTAHGSQKTQAMASAPSGVISGLRKLQLLRRKTIDQLRVRQPLMEEGTVTESISGRGGGGDGGFGSGAVNEFDSSASNCNSHGKYATGTVVSAATTTAAAAAITTVTLAAATATAAAASATTTTTTTSNYHNSSNNRNSSSGSYSLDGSSADGSNRVAGGTLLVTTTAVHNNNLHLDGNKMAEEAL